MSYARYVALVADVRRTAAELEATELSTLRARSTSEHGPPYWAAVAVRAVREVLGVELHDPQIAAGLAMADGWTVEMLTGEGKTFAAIGAAMAFAAQGRPVHVVTANAYLAGRDVDWSGKVLRSVGFTTGLTTAAMTRSDLRRAYGADVLFGDVSAFGFDFLTDGLCLPGDGPVQRSLDVAIVDEADAVLIDQARTPMVLTRSGPQLDDVLTAVAAAVRELEVGVHVRFDGEHRDAALTDEGIELCEELLDVENLYDATGADWPALIDDALRARLLLRRDHDYVVDHGDVLPIDELTGRVARNRRWPEGLQQAVEAKEGVAVSAPRRAAGQCTVGSYFRRYQTLVGMSGTLQGSDRELRDVFGIGVLRVPPNRPVRRIDHADDIAADLDAASEVIVADAVERHRRQQPVLVGTTSIEDTAHISSALTERGVAHTVLTAVNDHEEAGIIANAGAAGAVTVATQLAGRGVDIVIDDSSRAAGGLLVWGLGHHRSERQDNQLRGRSGRQGDLGESRLVTWPGAESVADAERLDRELRDDVRAYESVTDRLQEHLYEWRRRARAAPIDELLPAGSPVDRRAEVGATTFDGAARLILQVLLVELWSEALEVLESRQALARVITIVAASRRRWQVLAVETYHEFVSTVEREWISQLEAFRVGTQLPARSLPIARPSAPIDALPEPEDYQHHEWNGPSYNRFVRRHFYWRLPDPPLVLHLDAVANQAETDGLALHLDIDEPSNTVVVATAPVKNA